MEDNENPEVPQPVVQKTQPKKQELKERKLEPRVVYSSGPVRYRLNLYTATGTVRQSFNGSLLSDVMRRYGDIVRAVSSTRFMPIDELCESVWTIEKKMRYPTNRTRKQIETAIAELVTRGIIVTD